MQTQLSAEFRQTRQGQEANNILRSCVHCGFCTATCPTYQLLGDELDGPRGRIYLIKMLLEGETVTAKTQQHLDRCPTCRSCETTCPSGVRYNRLIDIGRDLVERQVRRGIWKSSQRYALRKLLPYPKRFRPFLKLGQWFKPLLPHSIQQKVPAKQATIPWPSQSHSRRMLILQGCVQSVATPATNTAAAQMLDKLGIEIISDSQAGCCGAVSHHLSAHQEGQDFMRRNIDAWWPYIEQGIEAIVITASACGAMIKEYGELLKHDKSYADKAKHVSDLTKDICEVLVGEELPQVGSAKTALKVAFHSPCTLQHGLKIRGSVESILNTAGFKLTRVNDGHLCCGSAGTYSILQPELSHHLLMNKLFTLQYDEPDVIATANVGCQLHLATQANVPVIHWIELLNESL